MIPKVIHYFWFGNKTIPEKEKHCIDSWSKTCPEYRIIQWNEKNYNYNKLPFMQNAAKAGKWSFVTDYARLDVINQYGGIYLDTDVELIKPMDDFLGYKAFFGFETNKDINTGLGFGSEKNNRILQEMMEVYGKLSNLKEEDYNQYYCPLLQTPIIEKAGIKLNGSKQVVDKIIVLPKDYMCPLDYDTGKLIITNNTYSIHWFQGSWKSEEERKLKKLWQTLTPIFGKKNAGHIAVLIGYPRYYGLKKTFKYYIDKIENFKH